MNSHTHVRKHIEMMFGDIIFRQLSETFDRDSNAKIKRVYIIYTRTHTHTHTRTNTINKGILLSHRQDGDYIAIILIRQGIGSQVKKERV